EPQFDINSVVRCRLPLRRARVVSGGYDYMVKVWDPETEVCLHTLQGHTNRVYSLQVNTHTEFFFFLKDLGSAILFHFFFKEK
uniref:Uncharacterized protein n=1 Tax=Maylandia zebra TaxID=106582 RepID=A0A3P9DUJ6_9CICH